MVAAGFFRQVAVAIALGVLPTAALSLENVRIGVVNTTDQIKNLLQPRLEAASLTMQMLEDEDDNVLDILGAVRAEYGRMLAALYEEGFYGPLVIVLVDDVEITEIDLFSPPASINSVVIAVDPGPRFTFGETDVAPRAPNATADPIVDGFERGGVALSGLVGAATNAAINEWLEEGHAKAEFEDQTLIANHADSELDVDVRLDPGPKLRFGNVSIEPGSEVSDRRVLEIMGFPTGKVFSPEELRVAGNRLRRSGVFRTVSLQEAEIPNPDGTLDYTLTLLDAKKRRIGVRTDYSTLDGFEVGGFFLHRNVFGGGESFRLDVDIEGLGETQGRGTTYRTEGRLTRPGTFGPDNNVYAYFLAERPDEDDYTETSIAVGAGISRFFSDRLYGETALGFRYSEAEDVFTLIEANETGEPERSRNFQHVILPSRLELDMRNNRADPTGGYFVNTSVLPYLGVSGSQSGVRLSVDARGYLGFGAERRLVLAGRTQIGSILGSDIDQTPPSFLFYSGGGNTVRGQPYQSLGVSFGEIGQSGGRSFLGLSGEIRGKVTKALGLVAFYDYGFIGADSAPGEDGSSQSGAGIGVRYDTPIGPVRLDLATPVSGDTADPYSDVELYIGIGQAF